MTPRRVRGLVKAVLGRAHLLGAARGLREAAHELAWELGRGRGEVDRELVARHLATQGLRRLHIGCGGNLLEGWLNADFRPVAAGILHLDATRPFVLLEDGVIDRVFSEHMIEHVPHADGLRMLAECHRVLRPGGIIRISTPDLAFLVELYRDTGSELHARYLAWSAECYPDVLRPEPAFVINNFVRDWGHRFIYDERTLRAALEQSGFSAVVRRPLMQSEDPSLRALENELRMPPGFLALETLTLEARKA